MKLFTPSFSFALTILVSAFSFEAISASKSLEHSATGKTKAEQKVEMAKLHSQLKSASSSAKQHTLHLTVSELDVIANPTKDSTGKLRVGVHRSVGKSVSNASGDLIISVAGATAIRLELSKVKGTVSVFNEQGQAHQYQEDGFTHTFWGDKVTVRGNAHVDGAGAVSLGGNLCSFNASCVENAECATTVMPTNISNSRAAYASILFNSGRYYYVCSGGLIADSDESSQIPYFLTANHCLSRGKEARTVETFFNYTQSCGLNNNCALPDSDTVGSNVVSTNRQGDYTLLRLSQTPPSNTVYLGWNTETVANNTDAMIIYRISHPGGAPQAYSEHVIDDTAPTCSSWPRGSWIYSRDQYGATEGGSSGSPVLNDAGQVVGQLSGACGYDVQNSCNVADNATVDGSFASYYPEIMQYLGGGSTDPGTCTDADGDGWCAESGDCDDNNSEINPGARDRGGRKWADGVDNNCNGIIDG